jgi:hypothetical protein
LPPLEQIRQKYADRDVAVVSMYVREPHPQERGFGSYRQPSSYDEKLAHAKELMDLKDMRIPLVIDDVDQRYHHELGNLPNMAYVVDKQGIVSYANNWTLADDIDAILATLVTADDASRPVQPTIETTSLGHQI